MFERILNKKQEVLELLSRYERERLNNKKEEIKEEITGSLRSIDSPNDKVELMGLMFMLLTAQENNDGYSVIVNVINDLKWIEDEDVQKELTLSRSPYFLHKMADLWKTSIKEVYLHKIYFNICEMLFENGNYYKYYKYISDEILTAIKEEKNEAGENILLLFLKHNPEYGYVKKMIELGIQINIKNNSGATVFDYIGGKENSDENLEILNFLYKESSEVEFSKELSQQNSKNKCFEIILAREREKELNAEIKKINKEKMISKKTKI